MTEGANYSRIDLEVINDGAKPTFERKSYGSYLDITLATIRAARLISDWRVLDEQTLEAYMAAKRELRKAIG